MAVKIIKDGKVVHSDKMTGAPGRKEMFEKTIEEQSEIELLNMKLSLNETIIKDLNNQIKDLRKQLLNKNI